MRASIFIASYTCRVRERVRERVRARDRVRVGVRGPRSGKVVTPAASRAKRRS